MCFVDWLSRIQKCMCIFVTTLSNMPLLMLCMFPHGLYSLLDLSNKLYLYLNCDCDISWPYLLKLFINPFCVG